MCREADGSGFARRTMPRIVIYRSSIVKSFRADGAQPRTRQAGTVQRGHQEHVARPSNAAVGGRSPERRDDALGPLGFFVAPDCELRLMTMA